MATLEDIVRIKLEVDETIQGLAPAQRKIASLENLGRKIGVGLGGALAGGFAIAAGVAGVGLLSRGIVGLQSEVQETEVGIASLVTALTGQDITSSLGQARTIVGQLKDDAAKGAGELGNYAQGFQRILGPANRAGATLKEVRELNRQALAAGFALRGAEGLLLAPMDVAQALTAGVGERTTPIVNQLLGAIKMTNAEFNKLSKRDRFDALTKAFATMDEGAKLMGQTFNAQTATFKDGVKDIIREVSRPVFDLWTTQLMSANEWMTDNRDKMKEMAEVWGPRLAGAWKGISRDPGTTAGALGAGAAGVGVARFGMAGGFGAMGGVMGGGAMVGGAAVAGILALVGAGFLMVKGAIGEYPHLLDVMGSSFAMLGFAFGKLLESVGMLTAPGSALNAFGAVIVGGFSLSVELFARGVMVVAAGIKFMASGFQQFGLVMEAMGDWKKMGGLFRAGSEFETIGAKANAALVQDLKAAITKPIRITKVRSNKTGEGDEGGGLEKPGQGDVNIGKIEVVVKSEVNEDPNRVAVAFSEVLSRVNEYRLQTRAAPLSPKPA